MARTIRFDEKEQSDSVPTVSQLTGQIRDTLECDFGDVEVRGEVSGFSQPRSGHWYFSLKDQDAQLSAVAWRSVAGRVKFQMEDGIEVVARGRISVYPPRGSYQLVVSSLKPFGEGSWRKAFERLHAQLKAEGLFDPSRKKNIPLVPKKIAVVTSATGAAVRDFLQVAARRWDAGDIVIVPTKVQGPGAAQEIAQAIGKAASLNPAPDVVVVTRGGGSIEDLWAFNEQETVRAVAACPIPIVSGVGHEIDMTLCDLAADVRALTPSEAAERIFPDKSTTLTNLENTRHRLASLLMQKIESLRSRIEVASASSVFRRPADMILQKQQKLDDLSLEMNRAVEDILQSRNHSLASLTAKLETLSPLGVLARGYSLTQSQSGQLVRNIHDVQPENTITTKVSNGEIVSVVQEVRSQ